MAKISASTLSKDDVLLIGGQRFPLVAVDQFNGRVEAVSEQGWKHVYRPEMEVEVEGNE